MLRKFKKQTTGVKEWEFTHKDGRHKLTGLIKFDARAPVSDVGTSWEVEAIGTTLTEVRTLDGVLVDLSDQTEPGDWLDARAFEDSFQFSAENSINWRAEVIDELNAQ